MTRHVPSHLTVTGHRVLLSYEGQPATCYGCGEVGHMYQGCPARQRSSQTRLNQAQQSYASIVSASTARKEHYPTTVTVNQLQQATPVNPDETSTIPTATQRGTDVHRNETGDVNPHAPTAPQTIERERNQGSIGAVNIDDRMDTMENMATDNTRAGLADRRGEDS